MDLSTIIVIVVLTALSLAAIIWLEVYSRRTKRELETSATNAAARVKSIDPGPFPKKDPVRE